MVQDVTLANYVICLLSRHTNYIDIISIKSFSLIANTLIELGRPIRAI